jgi:hypothetical protein
MMAKEGRPSIEETIIEEALGEKELENLLIGFLEALEKEQRRALEKDSA